MVGPKLLGQNKTLQVTGMELRVGKDLELGRNWNEQEKGRDNRINELHNSSVHLTSLTILQKYTVTDKEF